MKTAAAKRRDYAQAALARARRSAAYPPTFEDLATIEFAAARLADATDACRKAHA